MARNSTVRHTGRLDTPATTRQQDTRQSGGGGGAAVGPEWEPGPKAGSGGGPETRGCQTGAAGLIRARRRRGRSPARCGVAGAAPRLPRAAARARGGECAARAHRRRRRRRRPRARARTAPRRGRWSPTRRPRRARTPTDPPVPPARTRTRGRRAPGPARRRRASTAWWLILACRAVTRREIRSWLMDMDGVLVHEEQAIPGADRFLGNLRKRERAVPRADQQLDLHAPRSRRPAAGQRARGARGVDLDVRAGHGELPRGSAARRLGVRDRRGGADDRAARLRLHDDRARPGLRRSSARRARTRSSGSRWRSG